MIFPAPADITSYCLDLKVVEDTCQYAMETCRGLKCVTGNCCNDSHVENLRDERGRAVGR